MIFKRKNPAIQEVILKRVMTEIEKLVKELESEGKDITKIKFKKYQKTHHVDCTCPKCSHAKKKNNPRLRGLREFGFKIYVAENDKEDID